MTGLDLFAKLNLVNAGLRRRYPRGVEPFQIMTRLLEECGELAEQVNLFEDTGIKRTKLGEPDRAKLAKEVQDVLRCALQIAEYYGIEEELAASVDASLHRMVQEGLITRQLLGDLP
jgi:NTP pyrophosphatase (non-canonical NTP hydrolase)